MYTRIISETLKITTERARLVEAYLRLQYGTLGNLSREDIKREYKGHGGIGAAIDQDNQAADELAISYGLIAA